MSLFDLAALAADLPQAWRSSILGRVGSANIKVLRMDQRAIDDEVHEYHETLLVIEGQLRLAVQGGGNYGERRATVSGRSRRAASRVGGQPRHAGDC
ncbi:Uncharacterised protein [Serratia plymuthica]|uniref:Cupin domain n=1 Tax=Serratia plymuthica TaxID=82996 RepID=A0A2X4V1T6_SERPL|nr:Uncharacterised protein [Serratia plymuthica]